MRKIKIIIGTLLIAGVAFTSCKNPNKTTVTVEDRDNTTEVVVDDNTYRASRDQLKVDMRQFNADVQAMIDEGADNFQAKYREKSAEMSRKIEAYRMEAKESTSELDRQFMTEVDRFELKLKEFDKNVEESGDRIVSNWEEFKADFKKSMEDFANDIDTFLKENL